MKIVIASNHDSVMLRQVSLFHTALQVASRVTRDAPAHVILPVPWPVAAFARSASASRRLNLASSITPARIVSRPQSSVKQHCDRYGCKLKRSQGEHTRIGITTEVPTPLHECPSSMWPRRDFEAADSRQSAVIAERRVARDDRICDVVIQ